MKRAVIYCCLLIGVLVSAFPLFSQQNPPASSLSSVVTAQPDISKDVSDKLAQLDQRVTAAQSAGDNAWMLVSAALVLMMTGPGLALFYGGLVRQEKYAGDHDAEFRDDGTDHPAVGSWSVTAWRLAEQPGHWRFFARVPARGRRCSQCRITRGPFRNRLS